MERIVLFGMPGAGKGTQAQRIQSELGYRHISTGDMIRREVRRQTDIGLRIREITQSGRLIPDDLMLDLVRNVLRDTPIRKGYILDGFPRTLSQARKLEDIPVEREVAVYLRIDESQAVSRIRNRVVCPRCHKVYKAEESPADRLKICENCGASITSRPDDREEVIRKRIEIYRKETLPLVDYYQALDELITIDAGRTEQAVFQEIMEKLK